MLSIKDRNDVRLGNSSIKKIIVKNENYIKAARNPNLATK